MSEFIFFELKESVRQQLKLPTRPLPVRRERQQAVFLPAGKVDLPAMLEEVCTFLRENPARVGEYKSQVATLAYIAGTDAASRGQQERAIELYQTGLKVVPESVSLRSHCALALHALGRNAETRREIEGVIANSPKDTILPVLWIILARIYAQDGEYAKSYWLLKDVSATMPEADGFWDFLAEMEEKAGLAPALR